MKKTIKQSIYTFLLICTTLVFTGCDLEVQESFVFDPQTKPQFTFGATTPWEWLQTNPKGEYSYMIKAIKHAGLEAEFSNTTDKRTYFLLKDSGWSDASKVNTVLNREFGSQTILIEDTDPVKLRNILMYYILPVYVDQGPGNLKTLDAFYEFKTLSSDPGNTYLTLDRDWNYSIGINYAPGLSPNALGTRCKLHNYIFSNGNSVAHIIETHTRLEIFK
ncbi:fasciclin domain-containing protein [Polaribacter glomeratus]|nr:hypothetical protein [Polaribacter glomeratus]TXD67590.1 hypothetical protein ESX12_03120 [Polaribacter glomeratus]